MSEIKATSFRINDEDDKKFKQFVAEQGFNNQAEAFQAIMQTVELARAKGQIKDRAKEIEVFQDTINRIMGMFLNSLEVNQTSEDRIREELSKELLNKEDTISNLLEQVKKLNIDKSELEKGFKEKADLLKKAEEAILDCHDLTERLNKDIEDKQKTIDLLHKNNINQLEQLEEYKDLKITNDALLIQLEENEAKKLVLENNIKQLDDKLSNAEDMIKFHKDSISELKSDIAAYKEDIKDLNLKHEKYVEELESKHNKQVEAIKIEYEKSLDKEKSISEKYRIDLGKLDEKHQNQVKEIKVDFDNAAKKEIDSVKEQLNNKYLVSLEKKDLEIEKLKNEIEKLKSEFHKPVNNKTK
ncbi:hypothetical protein [Clostridium sp.]|uniref:hypothetical protein n=1 Tax=Clostridium sp. TaxID=1506 RepID=UPI00284D7F4B|nr:hypothetical protein [Clostridium sp.]MDR3598497.1 hypothetical protein [Clostridium sp.]